MHSARKRERKSRILVLFDLKLVSVKLAGLGFVLPTFSLAFYETTAGSDKLRPILDFCAEHTWKSFFFSFFLRLLEPIVPASKTDKRNL